jgi:hypothetical protein
MESIRVTCNCSRVEQSSERRDMVAEEWPHGKGEKGSEEATEEKEAGREIWTNGSGEG